MELDSTRQTAAKNILKPAQSRMPKRWMAENQDRASAGQQCPQMAAAIGRTRLGPLYGSIEERKEEAQTAEMGSWELTANEA